jgi:hypothetical protein
VTGVQFFKNIVAYAHILVILGCNEKRAIEPVIYDRGPPPAYCTALSASEGDEIFELFKKFTKKNMSHLFAYSKPTWVIYGPLKCGEKIAFSAEKKLQVQGDRVFLEVGAHFMAYYDEKTKTFEIVGGM